ncbi:hypothetical protein QE152_g39039 [Popillia japonica]|uniref:Endonuclease/exonuclease/phosphatase domain-containing protein n=1 Tax=Popillia japonica TaxID=7064 RepID=A0AAW1HV03_POPJA
MDIICTTETWCTEEVIALPKEFEEYGTILSPAIKEKSLGRPSGGLAILYKKYIQIEVIEVNNLWILTEVQLDEMHFLLMVNYWKPNSDIDFCVEILNDTLNEMCEKYPNHTWIVGGDFNGRVGILNQYEQETLSANINPQRTTRDNIMNSRGKKLIGQQEII